MKQLITHACIIVFILTALVACSTQSTTGTPSAASNPALGPQSKAVLNVEELIKNPEYYRGLLRVEGVVSFVSPERQTVALIDTQEFIKCGVTTCASLTLPVHWLGAMPHVENTVQVVGEIQTKNGKLVFVAHTLDIIQRQ